MGGFAGVVSCLSVVLFVWIAIFRGKLENASFFLFLGASRQVAKHSKDARGETQGYGESFEQTKLYPIQFT